jgi:hypothetical protein
MSTSIQWSSLQKSASKLILKSFMRSTQGACPCSVALYEGPFGWLWLNWQILDKSKDDF